LNYPAHSSIILHVTKLRSIINLLSFDFL